MKVLSPLQGYEGETAWQSEVSTQQAALVGYEQPIPLIQHKYTNPHNEKEVKQPLTVFHKQFSSCFLNYKAIRFFLNNNFISITASKFEKT